MSDEPIICRFVFTTKEYGRAMRNYWRHSRVKWLLLVVVMFCTGGIVQDVMNSTKEVPPPTATFVFLDDILPAILFVGLMAFIAWFAGPFYFRRSAYFNREITYTFRESGVHVHSPLAETELKWEIYPRATENRHGFALFQQGKRSFNWVAKISFPDAADVDRCRALIRKHVKDTKRLSAPVDQAT